MAQKYLHLHRKGFQSLLYVYIFSNNVILNRQNEVLIHTKAIRIWCPCKLSLCMWYCIKKMLIGSDEVLFVKY